MPQQQLSTLKNATEGNIACYILLIDMNWIFFSFFPRDTIAEFSFCLLISISLLMANRSPLQAFWINELWDEELT